MNKILVDGDKIILAEPINKIEVDGSAKIYINNIDFDLNLEVRLHDDARLEIYDCTKNNFEKNLNVFQENNSYMAYYHSFAIDEEYNFKYCAYINGNNNTNNIKIMGISNGKVFLDVDEIVQDKTKNNILNEDIRILTIDGVAFVAPKLHVNCLDVQANHNTAISNIREDELFYLMSRGIDINRARNLIKDGYLYGYFKSVDEEFYNLIKE